MGGSSLPTAHTPGYTLYQERVACTCLATWLDTAERLGLARGLIKFCLDIVQLTGGYKLSGNTHSQGGAADLKQRTDEWIEIYREMGAAAWRRDGPDWEGNEHCHLIIPCPHNTPAAYQLTACKRGYNGLGKATSGPYAGQWGYGGRDPHRAPSKWRTYSAGLAWAEAEIAKLTPTIIKEDFLMSLTDDEQKRILAAADRTMGRDPQRYMAYDDASKTWRNVPKGTKGARPAPSLDSLDGQTLRNDIGRVAAKQAADTAAILAALTSVAGGGSIDPALIAKAAEEGASKALATLTATVTISPGEAE